MKSFLFLLPLLTLSWAGFADATVDLRSLRPAATLYHSARETFPAKFERLNEARHSILISTFSIKPDTWYARDDIGRSLADILIQKYRQGLEVKVFTDYWGNPPTTRAEVYRMIRAGVDVRFFGAPENAVQFSEKAVSGALHMNFENLNHGKTMIVDGWNTFTGGYNWMSGKTRDSKYWRDTDLFLTGPVAQQMSQEFYRIFQMLKKQTSDPERPVTRYLYPENESGFKDEFLMQAPWLQEGKTPINEKLSQLIRSARSGDAIYWQSFSFRPRQEQIEALRLASQRGVQIHIVTNSEKNLNHLLFFVVAPPIRKLMARALYRQAQQSYGELLSLTPRNPARIYEFQGDQGPLHAKAFLIVRAETLTDLIANRSPLAFSGICGIGGYNVSGNSWNKHLETVLFTDRPSVVRDLYSLYQEDIQKSLEVTKQH